MPGIVIDGTAYLNGKKVFGSAIGGTCVYDSAEQTITVEKDNNSVVFPIRNEHCNCEWSGNRDFQHRL